ncbi:MAG: hypothetical protein H0X26_04540 [Alphaproteobacteria bacterium]|nr:hypothetical protein [Alphaproteobacteria bacterium]
MKTILRIFCLIPLFVRPAQGLEKQPYKTISSKSIKNLDESLQKAENTLGFPVLFPTFIPDDRELYAHTASTGGLTIISFSLDETCHGVKACTLGSLNIWLYGHSETRKDISGKSITEVVNLSDNTKGYYTPGHSMADYWPPSLQWSKKKDVLHYDLWWAGMDEATSRRVLIDMANSAILLDPQKKPAY